MSEPTSAPETVPASPPEPPVPSDGKPEEENDFTERTVPVTDPPMTGAVTTAMPPLVVKQSGVSKSGAAGSVSFDYTGPAVKVTNGTVLDLVTQFGIPNAWTAVLKLRGWDEKEDPESILPIKRFRERVRKLKQNADSLKARSDDTTTFYSKEFLPRSMDVPAKSSEQKEMSSTDAVIESILRNAEVEASQAAQTAPAFVKPKRGRKKNNVAPDGPSTSAASPDKGHSSTIDAVVSSVIDKIRNNEPFEGEDRACGASINFANFDLPSPQPAAPPPPMMVSQQPMQVMMVQDEAGNISYIPQQQIISHSQAPQLAAPPAIKGRAKGGRKGKAVLPVTSAPTIQSISTMPNFYPASAGRGQSSAGPPVAMIAMPRGANPVSAAQTTYAVTPGYSTAKLHDNTTLYFSNINDLLQQTNGSVAKVVTYQQGMQLPPGTTFVTNPTPQGVASPTAFSKQVAPSQVIVQQPTATLPAITASSQPPAAPEAAADDKKKKTPRRRSAKAKTDGVLMEKFNDSDFEELATPKRKESLKKSPIKKGRKAAPEKLTKAATKTAVAAAAAKKTTKKSRAVAAAAPEPEEEADDESDAGFSGAAADKNKQTAEIAQLRKQLQAERSRHYTQKRRATKLDDDYKRVLDRLQQTELNLALQMSECERLQAELKKLTDANKDLVSQMKTKSTPKNGRATTARAKRGVSPSPAPSTSKKSVGVKGTKAAAAAAASAPAGKVANNRKRGRPPATVTPPDSSESKPPSPSPSDPKPMFNPDDFIPRRAAAAKRIRYF